MEIKLNIIKIHILNLDTFYNKFFKLNAYYFAPFVFVLSFKNVFMCQNQHSGTQLNLLEQGNYIFQNYNIQAFLTMM